MTRVGLPSVQPGGSWEGVLSALSANGKRACVKGTSAESDSLAASRQEPMQYGVHSTE